MHVYEIKVCEVERGVGGEVNKGSGVKSSDIDGIRGCRDGSVEPDGGVSEGTTSCSWCAVFSVSAVEGDHSTEKRSYKEQQREQKSDHHCKGMRLLLQKRVSKEKKAKVGSFGRFLYKRG